MFYERAHSSTWSQKGYQRVDRFTAVSTTSLINYEFRPRWSEAYVFGFFIVVAVIDYHWLIKNKHSRKFTSFSGIIIVEMFVPLVGWQCVLYLPFVKMCCPYSTVKNVVFHQDSVFLSKHLGYLNESLSWFLYLSSNKANINVRHSLNKSWKDTEKTDKVYSTANGKLASPYLDTTL